MKICLIKPALLGSIQKFRWGGGHLGIAYIASYLEKAGINCSVIDAESEMLGIKEIGDRVYNLSPDIIGITAMTHEIHLVSEIAERIKNDNARCLIVVGGPHATAIPLRTLEEFKYIDVAVYGEGEKTMLEIVKAVDSQKNDSCFDNILGIAYRKGYKIKKNHPRQFMSSTELDELPFPAWHLFPDQAFPLFAGRGCPFSCLFCMRVHGNRVRMRSPENVISEIEYLYRQFGKESSWFRDETFGLNKNWTNRFLDLLEKFRENYKVDWTWTANSRANIADIDIYKRMAELGCKMLSFGIESGNPKVLETIRKDITLDKALKAIKMAKSAGIKTSAFFIIGHPNENLSTALDTIRFAAKLNADSIAVGVMVPYPGTEIWSLAKNGEAGYQLLSEDWRLYDKYFGGALRLKNLSDRKLKFLQSICYIWFYIRNLRVKDLYIFCNKHLKQLTHMMRILFPHPQ